MSQGLLDWANSIRLTMENDPGRQYFKDQIQSHGFDFLDDYLDNILSGPRTDPLIELVKTPGRKRTVTKPKGLSKLNSSFTLALEVDSKAKENSPPHKALELHDKDLDNITSSNPFDGRQNITNGSLFGSVEATNAIPNPSLRAVDNLYEPTHDLSLPPPKTEQSTMHTTSHAEQELSVIVEDEESHEINRSPVRPGALPAEAESLHSMPDQSDDLGGKLEHNVAISASTQTLHSIPLNSPIQDIQPMEQDVQRTPQPPFLYNQLQQSPLLQRTPIPETTQMSTTLEAQDAVGAQTVSEDAKDSIPESTSQSPGPTNDSKPSNYVDVDVPLHDSEAPGSPRSQAKATFPALPPLPGPLPLRKSLRFTREHTSNATALGTATPGAALGGKRTSWLMKAREVKALEVGTKKPGSLDTNNAPASTIGVKRKSSEMLGSRENTGVGADTAERQQKISRTEEPDHPSISPPADPTPGSLTSKRKASPTSNPPVSQEAVFDRFKKTVEGLGARSGKSMAPSFDVTSRATALAEARAMAEAAVAERKSKEDETLALTGAYFTDDMTVPITDALVDDEKPHHPRMSVSELFADKSDTEGTSEKATPVASADGTRGVDESNDPTTPPKTTRTSQQPSTVFSLEPVFSKPPVFAPPNPKDQEKTKVPSSGFVFTLPPSNAFSKPAPMSVGLAPRFGSPSRPASPQRASPLFMPHEKESLLWQPSNQGKDTDQTTSTHFTNSDPAHPFQFGNTADDDDSWPLEEGPIGNKEDNTTWSTFTSNSQTHSLQQPNNTRKDSKMTIPEDRLSQNAADELDIDVNMNQYDEGYEEEPEAEVMTEVGTIDSELDDAWIHSKPTIALVKPKKGERPEPTSVLQPAQSTGIFGHAAKLLQNAWGAGKKPKADGKQENRLEAKPEIKRKTYQTAPLATKKEEEDKKAARLKEAENSRIALTQKKVEEEKAKASDKEKKLKEETERRKREREENTDKRPLKPMGVTVKKDDDPTKKRKIGPEPQKKVEIKKPIPFNLGPPKSAMKSALKQSTTSSSAVPLSRQLKMVDPKAKGKAVDDDVSQPSQLLQSQMAARAKAQLAESQSLHQTGLNKTNNAAPTSPKGSRATSKVPTVASEEIELPEVNSEYSDSDDENRPRYQGPDWTRSPELQEALRQQSTIDPDDVFGQVLPPLNMEEIFNKPGQKPKFRARTSSANWNGPDGLSGAEIQNYKRRMGFGS